MKKRDCTIGVAKTKALISFAVTAKMICVFVFAYAKSRISHDTARLTDGDFQPISDLLSACLFLSSSLPFPVESNSSTVTLSLCGKRHKRNQHFYYRNAVHIFVFVKCPSVVTSYLLPPVSKYIYRNDPKFLDR